MRRRLVTPGILTLIVVLRPPDQFNCSVDNIRQASGNAMVLALGVSTSGLLPLPQLED